MENNKLQNFINKYKNILPEEAFFELLSISKEYSYLTKIFNSNDCTISLVDENGTYLIINPKMQNLTGDIVGKKVGEMSKQLKISEMLNYLKNNNQINEISEIVESIINETRKIFLIQMTRVEDKFLLMGSDITEIEGLKRQQEFNDRMVMLGEMSSFIMHEINNPLNAISMSAEIIELMSKGKINPEKMAQPLNNIMNMVETISKIISTLKSFSRKSEGNSEILDFEKIFNQAELVLKPKLKMINIILSKEIDSSELVGSEIEFLQVLVNLISNSIDAIQDKEEKWIKVVWKNSQLQIIDSGKGIPQKIVGRLFEKFHTTKGSKGNGIGLYLSKEILNKNGYELEYKLENDNTSFCWIKKSA